MVRIYPCRCSSPTHAEEYDEMEEQNEKDASVVVVQPSIETMTWTIADEKRIRRHIDFRVLPMVFVLYLATFIDRLVYLKVDALFTDLSTDLTLGEYHTLRACTHSLTVCHLAMRESWGWTKTSAWLATNSTGS